MTATSAPEAALPSLPKQLPWASAFSSLSTITFSHYISQLQVTTSLKLKIIIDRLHILYFSFSLCTFQKVEMFDFSAFACPWAAGAPSGAAVTMPLQLPPGGLLPSHGAFYPVRPKPQMEASACQAAGSSQEGRKGGCQADEIFMPNLIQPNTSLLDTYSQRREEGQGMITEHLLCARPLLGLHTSTLRYFPHFSNERPDITTTCGVDRDLSQTKLTAKHAYQLEKSAIPSADMESASRKH